MKCSRSTGDRHIVHFTWYTQCVMFLTSRGLPSSSNSTMASRTAFNQGSLEFNSVYADFKGSLMYPIFIVDEPDAEEDIPSLPLQKRLTSSIVELTKRWGVNKIVGFLRPLVQKGLRSVILFGVPLLKKKDSVGTLAD